MASEAESMNMLGALDALMLEFFEPLTTNERKRQIEELLNNFSQQRDAWRHCLFFLGNTNNQYVSMYCMTVLENLINRQWIGFPGQDKEEIRNRLNQFLLTRHQSVPSFVRNKLVKLVVDIGRLDWPHFYPSFFSSIIELSQQQDTVALGLILLQTTSEELACPREDLSVARKEELHRLLLQQVPTVLSVLNNLLESILEKHRSMVTATPPPSPTHGQSEEGEPKTSMSVITSSPVQSSNLLSNMFHSPQTRVQMESLPPLDAAAHNLSLLALRCLSHLFSWIPLSSTITPRLLNTIFHFAAFGCEVAPSRHSSEPGVEATNSLGGLAMCCINELLAKNCVPQEFEDFLLQMFQQTFYLLQRITRDGTANSTGNRLSDLDESYIDKFTDFLRLFVSIHLRRFESNSQFPMLDFLALLFKYTFKQPSHEGFYACLDIWGVFLDYLATSLENRTSDHSALLTRYEEALVALVSQILQKMQFRYNQLQLDELDDETLDDDSETEWQHFLRQCVEIVAKVAELMPAQVFQLVYQPFHEFLELYLGVEQFVVSSPQGRKLSITAENECRRLHCLLRDLSSFLQTLGRLAEHFTGEHFTERFSDGQRLVDRLLQTASYGTKIKLYEINSSMGTALQADFVELHAQALAGVKAYATWLAQFYAECQQQDEHREKCNKMVTSLLHMVLPLLLKGVPDKVAHSAAHLLLSVLTTVRPSSALDNQDLGNFYTNVSQGSLQHLNMQIQLLVYRSLSHYLLLAWPGLQDSKQMWEARAKHHSSFLGRLTSQYQALRDVTDLGQNQTLQQQAKPCVKKTLQLLTDLVETIAVEGVSKSKQICYQSIQPLVQVTLALFPIYIHHTDVTEDMLGLFLALFQGLRVQTGVSFTESTIQTFMSMFTREQLAEIISQESTTAYKVIERFLKILQLIVQEPSAAFKSFLPHVISICMDYIHPIIAERPSPDIKPCLYELLHNILDHNWRYFYKGSMLPSIQEHDIRPASEQLEHQPQFVAIMQAFGQSFLQSDIAVFKQNLEILENLNMKCKLYRKDIFKDLMLVQFVTVLLQVLVSRSHDLLQEEIGITLYNMAGVDDFHNFYNQYLHQFLAQSEGLDDNQRAILATNFKPDKDLPSFTQGLQRFVNDLRYYQLCNSSLPAGSVKL